jgi:hypothetical protein
MSWGPVLVYICILSHLYCQHKVGLYTKFVARPNRHHMGTNCPEPMDHLKGWNRWCCSCSATFLLMVWNVKKARIDRAAATTPHSPVHRMSTRARACCVRTLTATRKPCSRRATQLAAQVRAECHAPGLKHAHVHTCTVARAGACTTPPPLAPAHLEGSLARGAPSPPAIRN